MIQKRFLTLALSELIPYANNPRINEDAVDDVAESIRQTGNLDPIEIDEDNVILSGHTRLMALQRLGYTQTDVVQYIGLTDDQKRKYRLLANKTGEKAEWDFGKLGIELAGLDFDGFDFGFAENNISEKYTDKTPGALKEKFIMPPFSVLDARQGDWQKRKKAWMTILDSGKGRADDLIGAGLKDLAKATGANTLTGTSIFDPVLCEILINWFSPKGGKIIDPFAGGSVRGIVSSFLQRDYFGNDLSEEQINANIEQFKALQYSTDFFGEKLKQPNWSIGDSKDIDKIITCGDFDMLLTCPPYADLEVYSNNPADISNMDYADFLTVQTVEKTGAKYYNELILITMAGTLALRAGRTFEASRKISNSHQKALVFLRSNGNDEALKAYLDSFEKEKKFTAMKKSILVFLRGNSKLAKADLDKYDFSIF